MTPSTPLTEPAVHVLLSLADGEKHGYAVLKHIQRSTAGEVKLNVSTLYGVLQRLEREGLIAESSARPDPVLDDERRRYFRITDRGTEVLRSEMARYRRLLVLAGEAGVSEG